MAKKNDNPQMNAEKDFAKLQRELGKQTFETEADLKEFLNGFMGKSLNDIPTAQNQSNEEKAQDLVYEAYEVSIVKGKKLIKEALKLDANCVDAYNYLAEIEEDPRKSIIQFEKAISAGEKSLGKKIFTEDKGHFWAIFETRPYMRAKEGLARCLFEIGETEGAVKHCEEMLELNEGDNQGIRYFLAPILVQLGEDKKYQKLVKQFKGESSAIWAFTYALFQFKTKGEHRDAEKALLKAHKTNEFVIDYMLGLKKMPAELPDYIGMGDENEAIVCVYELHHFWMESQEYFEWLVRFKHNQLI